MLEVRIRPLQAHKDYEGCVGIQREVWRHTDLDITPVHQFCISVQTGAVLLGAFAGKTLAGYVYSFPAVVAKKNCQHSHHLAVLPRFQGAGIGKKLKYAQWQECLKRGYDLVTWTFDPLLTRNANLNLHTLGAVGRTYLDDFYGRTPALTLDAGVPTDRLLVEWWIKSNRVRGRMAKRESPLDPGPLAKAVEQRPGGAYPGIAPGRTDLTLERARVLVELPKNVREMKAVPGAIARWQKSVRTALKHYFAAGYQLDDFILGERCFYVLKKTPV